MLSDGLFGDEGEVALRVEVGFDEMVIVFEGGSRGPLI